MKKIGYMLTSILVMVFSFVLINRLQEKNFTVFNDVAADQMETIKSQLQETDEFSFTALMCNEIRVPFDDATNTFFVPLDMENTDWETLKFTSGQGEYRILFESDITDEDKQKVIADGRRVELLVYTDQFWSEYYVTFTGLPIIDLALK